MKSSRLLMALPLLLMCSMAVASCSAHGSALQTYPHASLLTEEPEPQPTPEIVTSATASTLFRIEKDAWGRRGWSQVRGICTWAKERGFKEAPC